MCTRTLHALLHTHTYLALSYHKMGFVHRYVYPASQLVFVSSLNKTQVPKFQLTNQLVFVEIFMACIKLDFQFFFFDCARVVSLFDYIVLLLLWLSFISMCFARTFIFSFCYFKVLRKNLTKQALQNAHRAQDNRKH